MWKPKAPTIELTGEGRFQQCGEGRVELPVRVNGIEQVIYFASRDCALRPSDEALVSATLLPCMVAGYDYPRPLTLDPQFQAALPSIQDFYRAWLNNARSVQVPSAPNGAGTKSEQVTKVGTFFHRRRRLVLYAADTPGGNHPPVCDLRDGYPPGKHCIPG